MSDLRLSNIGLRHALKNSNGQLDSVTKENAALKIRVGQAESMRAHVDQLHQQAISRAEAANALLDKQRNELHKLTALNHSLNALNIRLTNAVLTFVEAQQEGELFPEPRRISQ